MVDQLCNHHYVPLCTCYHDACLVLKLKALFHNIGKFLIYLRLIFLSASDYTMFVLLA